MTIDTMDATPEADHAALLGAGLTARQIAASAVRIANSDTASAYFHLLAGESLDEAVKILDEAVDQIRHAKSILTGNIWNIDSDAGGPTSKK